VKAAGFSRFGGPEVVEVVELADPEPGAGEVRIRVAAATVNPTDVLLRSGGRPGVLTGEPPYVAGLELAGVIDAVGPGADWRPGEEVIAITTAVPDGRGAQAELAVTDARSVARVPEGADLAAAATVPMNGLTARLALDRLDLPAGATLLVSGAAGGVGGYVTELAAGEGLEVVGVARAGDEAEVRELGAAHFVGADEDLADAVRRIAPRGVDAAVDAAVLGEALLPAVRGDGTLVALRPFAGKPERGIAIEQIQVRDYLFEGEKLQGLADLLAAGKLTPRLGEVLPLRRAADAHRAAERPGRGRVVLGLRPGLY
jgi:NADPH2:quinone reductase